MKTLVIGASLNPERYSNKAIVKLVQHQHQVFAVGLKSGIVQGVTISTTPIEIEDLHTVTLYLNPLRQREFYDYIISLAPKRVIFNPGTENPELMQLLSKSGIAFEQSCTLVLLATSQY